MRRKGGCPFHTEATDHDWFDHFLVIKVRAQTVILEEGASAHIHRYMCPADLSPAQHLSQEVFSTYRCAKHYSRCGRYNDKRVLVSVLIELTVE